MIAKQISLQNSVVMEQAAHREEIPIRPVDQLVLDLLRREEGLSIQDLMDRLEVTATAIRQRIDRLVDSGYIERRWPWPSIVYVFPNRQGLEASGGYL
jgi:DNA-binding MarR family transcriptional regulator